MTTFVDDVVLLCHFNDDFDSEDLVGRTGSTNNGTPVIDTGESVFGAGSLETINQDRIEWPSSNDYGISDSVKFQITCQVKIPEDDTLLLLFKPTNSEIGTFDWFITVSRFATPDRVRMEYYDSTDTFRGLTFSNVTIPTVFSEIRISGDGAGNMRLYIDGTQDGGTQTIHANGIRNSGATKLTLGAFSDQGTNNYDELLLQIGPNHSNTSGTSYTPATSEFTAFTELVKVVDDDENISESIIPVITNAIFEVVNDSIEVSENVTTTILLLGNINETEQINESVLPLLIMPVIINDTLNISESPAATVFTVIRKQLDFIYGSTLAKQIRLVYETLLSKTLSTPYSIMTELRKQISTLYDITNVDKAAKQLGFVYRLQNNKQLSFPYSILTLVKNQISQPYAVTEFVRKQLSQVFDLSPLNEVRKQIKQIYSGFTGAPTIFTFNSHIIFNNTIVEILRADLSASENSFIWTANITLVNPNDFSNFKINDLFTLNFQGENYSLMVDTLNRGRTGNNVLNLTMRAISPTAVHEIPRADPVNITFTVETLASAAADSIVGVPVTWNTVDWLVPPDLLSIENGAPIQLLKTLAESVGATIVTDFDGTLIVIDKFPIPVVDFEVANVAHTFFDTTNNISVLEDFQPSRSVNKIRIRDITIASTDTMDFVFDEIISVDDEGEVTRTTSTNVGTLRVFPKPFTSDLTITSSRPTLAIEKIGESIETTVEDITIINSGGSVALPVNSIDGIVWETSTLGSINFVVGDTAISTSSVCDYGIGTLTYKTRFIKFRITGIFDTRVQLTLQRLDGLLNSSNTFKVGDIVAFENGVIVSGAIDETIVPIHEV